MQGITNNQSSMLSKLSTLMSSDGRAALANPSDANGFGAQLAKLQASNQVAGQQGSLNNKTSAISSGQSSLLSSLQGQNSILGSSGAQSPLKNEMTELGESIGLGLLAAFSVQSGALKFGTTGDTDGAKESSEDSLKSGDLKFGTTGDKTASAAEKPSANNAPTNEAPTDENEPKNDAPTDENAPKDAAAPAEQVAANEADDGEKTAAAGATPSEGNAFTNFFSDLFDSFSSPESPSGLGTTADADSANDNPGADKPQTANG